MSMSDATVIAFESWQAPDLSHFKHKGLEASENELDPIAIAALRQTAYEEGFAQGLSEGNAQGFKEGEAAGLALTQDRADQFLALLQGIDAPLISMDAHLAREVAHLAALVGAELARSQITVDPEILYAHVQRISEALPSLQHPPKIFLHPADRLMVAGHIETLPERHPAKLWALHDEPSLDRGDCRLQGRDSQLTADLTVMAKDIVQKALRAPAE